MKKAALFRTVLVVILVVFMFACLSSCGAKTESNINANTVTANDASASTSEATEQKAIDPLGSYNPAIELTSLITTNPSFVWQEGDDINNNCYTRLIEKKLGIKMKYAWVTDGGQYDTKLNVTIASGDLPDFFRCNSKTMLSLAKAGLIADLTEIYDSYASPILKSYGEAFPEGIDSAKVDGKMMALPDLNYGIVTMPNILWIRSDWLQKSGLEAPKTTDELVTLAKAFMANNKGAYGIGLHSGIYGGIESIDGLANSFHAYPKTWIKDSSGQIVFGSIQPEMKLVLKYLQDMYKSGIISKEFGIKDVNKVGEDIYNNKVGIQSGANWNCYFLGDAVKKDVNAVWKPYPLPSCDGAPVKVQSAWPVGTYYVTTKSCKNPEALIKVANLWCEIRKGNIPEDEFKENAADWICYPVICSDPNNDYKENKLLSEALEKKDPSNLSDTQKKAYESDLLWLEKKDPNYYSYYTQKSPEGSLSILSKYYDEGNILLTELRGGDTPTMAEKMGVLEKLELDAINKIIMGAPVEDEFNKFVEKWKKLGGDEITKEVNAQYNK